jgi:hypothetical protein
VTLGPIQVALQVADALEGCGLLYLVGGSVASSIGGEPRTTLDVDIVVAMAETDVDRFLAALGTEFYADDAAIRRAIRQHSSVNLIHQPSAFKVDLFIAGGSPLDEQQIGRRRRVQVSENPDRYLYVHTPEDILLQKLRWFRLGQGVSDRQWRDVLGRLPTRSRCIGYGPPSAIS